jgi:hypothetical protein
LGVTPRHLQYAVDGHAVAMWFTKEGADV